jgi:hypothetical protein
MEARAPSDAQRRWTLATAIAREVSSYVIGWDKAATGEALHAAYAKMKPLFDAYIHARGPLIDFIEGAFKRLSADRLRQDFFYLVDDILNRAEREGMNELYQPVCEFVMRQSFHDSRMIDLVVRCIGLSGWWEPRRMGQFIALALANDRREDLEMLLQSGFVPDSSVVGEVRTRLADPSLKFQPTAWSEAIVLDLTLQTAQRPRKENASQKVLGL